MADQPNLQQLWDSEQIRQCLYRYCRGIDRMDETALRSVAWPEGPDQHGSFVGTASEFVDWALKILPYVERGVHQVHNVMIAFEGETAAAVESVFTALHRQPDDDGSMVVLHMCGRYLDRFEKRNGEWRIAARQVIFDWIEKSAPTPGVHPERFGARTPVGGRFPNDPLYAFLGQRD